MNKLHIFLKINYPLLLLLLLPPALAGQLQMLNIGLEVGSPSPALGIHLSPLSNGDFAGVISPNLSPKGSEHAMSTTLITASPNLCGKAMGSLGVTEVPRSQIQVSINGSAFGSCRGGGRRRRSHG